MQLPRGLGKQSLTYLNVCHILFDLHINVAIYASELRVNVFDYQQCIDYTTDD